MVSLSFECYAYEHGAEIGMWTSVNLDLLLYIVQFNVWTVHCFLYSGINMTNTAMHMGLNPSHCFNYLLT